VPRKPETSFELKALIWEKAATTGKKPEVILRELDYELEILRKEGKFHEDTPDVRTIKRIIERDINLLSPEVVIAKLPPYMWHLRDDYEAIKSLTDRTTQEFPHSKELSTAGLIIASNLEKFRNAPSPALGDPFGHTVYTVGENVYGGWWIEEDKAKLGDVDRELAAELLDKLKEEGDFPELVDIDDWSELNYDLITESFIQRLIARAHRGDF